MESRHHGAASDSFARKNSPARAPPPPLHTDGRRFVLAFVASEQRSGGRLGRRSSTIANDPDDPRRATTGPSPLLHAIARAQRRHDSPKRLMRPVPWCGLQMERKRSIPGRNTDSPPANGHDRNRAITLESLCNFHSPHVKHGPSFSLTLDVARARRRSRCRTRFTASWGRTIERSVRKERRRAAKNSPFSSKPLRRTIIPTGESARRGSRRPELAVRHRTIERHEQDRAAPARLRRRTVERRAQDCAASTRLRRRAIERSASRGGRARAGVHRIDRSNGPPRSSARTYAGLASTRSRNAAIPEGRCSGDMRATNP